MVVFYFIFRRTSQDPDALGDDDDDRDDDDHDDDPACAGIFLDSS